MGLAPQVRRRLKATMGRQMGLQKTGNVDILFDMMPQHRDPDYGAFEDQVRLYRRFYGNWPEHLGRAWQVHRRERLQQVKYPWQHAKGPVAALQCYLHEHGWNYESHTEWTKPGHNGQPEFRLNMHADWFFLKQELARARRWETVMKINQRSQLSEVQQPLDWLPWRRLSRTLNKQQNLALQTWHQGALFSKSSEGQEGKHVICPHCQVEATTIHLLWTCPQTQKAEALEEELKVTDQRYQKIAPLAIQRTKHLFEDKGHFLHEAKETGKKNRAQAREAKSQMFLDIGNQHQDGGHVWQTKGSGLQCGGCSKRITKHWKMVDLAAVKNEKCPAGANLQITGGSQTGLSKGETLQKMLTGALPEMSAHRFELQKNYLVCMEGKSRILRHAAKDKLVALATTTCWNGPWEEADGWDGHNSHVMWRQGGRLSCQQCKAHAISKDGKFQTSKRLRLQCGADGRQSKLPTCFRAKKAA